ncbi:MAG: hypothetical protein M9962_13235 [Oligoflexia bacterium]|nr:hypothetical protein [Oligoflexia bacterium]
MLISILYLFLVHFSFADQKAQKLEKALCPFRELEAKKFFVLEHDHGFNLQEMKKLFTEYEKFFGKCKKVLVAEKNKYMIEYQYMTLPLEVEMSKNKIKNFSLDLAFVRDDSFEKFKEYIESLNEKIAYGVFEGSKLISGVRENESMNLERSSWLKVVPLLEEKRVARDKVIQLKKEWLNESYGDLHEWGEGSFVTVESLIRSMVWFGDGSALDHILLLINKEKLDSNHLFPSWRSHLGLGGLRFDSELSMKSIYEKGDQNSKKKFEAQIDPSIRLRVGWFSSPSEICNILNQLKTEKILQLSPQTKGIQSSTDDRIKIVTIARDVGVAHSAAIIEDKKKSYCVSLAWNSDEEVPESIMETVWRRLLLLL